jgi:hypothetical protein
MMNRKPRTESRSKEEEEEEETLEKITKRRQFNIEVEKEQV